MPGLWKSLAFALVVAASSVPAYAADFTVTKTADTNDGICNADCSLREAIVAANASPGSKIILGTGLTYALTLGPADVAGALTPGSGDLDITAALTIDGHGSTINPSGLDRVFDIQGSFIVTINDLTITGGVATGFLSLGGGINIRGANVVLNNCIVTGNSTALESSARDDGGGIAVMGSYAVPAGTATLAGLTLNNSTVSNNIGSNGGGILCVLCSLTVSNTIVSGNSAIGGDGGGIDALGNASALSITSSAIASNTVSGGSARGGGLSVPLGTSTTTLTRNRIASNAGTTGSAVFNNVASVSGLNNWWGCNFGPGVTGAGCSGTPNTVSGTITTSPYLVLKASASPTTIITNATSTVTADLTFNSVNADTSGGGRVPNGTSAAFSGALGSFATPTATTTNGKATDVFTAGVVEGTTIISVVVDAQSVTTSILIVTLPGTTTPQSQTINPGQTAGMSVTATGTPPLHYQWYQGPSATTTTPVGADVNSYTTVALFATTRYWVRVSNPYGSTDSAAATITVRFTDETLTIGVSMIRAAHITELRTHIDSLRTRLGLQPFVWTDSVLTAGTTMSYAQHIIDLRTALAQAYTAAQVTQPTYADPNLVPGMTIKRVHITELRAAVVAIE